LANFFFLDTVYSSNMDTFRIRTYDVVDGLVELSAQILVLLGRLKMRE